MDSLSEPARCQPSRRMMDVMAQTRCMIVEDQVLIGMSLEAFLEDAGFEVAGIFMSNVQALQWLEGDAPDVAILDIMIRDVTLPGDCLGAEVPGCALCRLFRPAIEGGLPAGTAERALARKTRQPRNPPERSRWPCPARERRDRPELRTIVKP
ncbi:MAG: response regulator [Microvirga sp.]|jgi:CheY-like chemotaxis protein